MIGPIGPYWSTNNRGCEPRWGAFKLETDRGQAIAALRAMIESGTYGPGDRLPPERELMASLTMSRGTLRRALDVLEREGRIWRHVGKGTFVANIGDGNVDDWTTALSRQLTPFKMMRARMCLEPAIAREAAVNASAEAMLRIHDARRRAKEASSWAEYESQDDRFHREIALACDNVLLAALFDRLNEVRRTVAFDAVVRHSTKPAEDHTSFAEHDRIAVAIEARDPKAAQAAMQRHLGSVSARLFGEAV